MLGWLVAIFGTLVVAGSILWIKPSKRELRITALRQEAMKKGLRVRLVDEKLKDKFFPWLDDYRGYVIYETHQLPVKEGRGMKAVQVHSSAELHELDRRNMDGDQARVLANQEHIPNQISGVVLYPDGVGLLWDESGDAGDIDGLLECIKLLHSAC